MLSSNTMKISAKKHYIKFISLQLVHISNIESNKSLITKSNKKNMHNDSKKHILSNQYISLAFVLLV